jgi:hypothetical protein
MDDIKDARFCCMNRRLWAYENDRYFGSLCSVHRRIQHGYTFILISINRYVVHLVPCGIWRWVSLHGFERWCNSLQKAEFEIDKLSMHQLFLQTPPTGTLFHIPPFSVAQTHVKVSKAIRAYLREEKSQYGHQVGLIGMRLWLHCLVGWEMDWPWNVLSNVV